MDWYEFRTECFGRTQTVVQQLTDEQAERLGAHRVPADKLKDNLVGLLVGLTVPTGGSDVAKLETSSGLA